MKVLVTVGSTHFDSLIAAVDKYLVSDDLDVTIQLADGQYKPKHHQFISFSDDIEQLYKDADIVITHAGAGTVYRLLELGKKIVVVPNFDRIDDHQLDIATYMFDNGFTGFCQRLKDIKNTVLEAAETEFKPYQYEAFDGYQQIWTLFGQCQSKVVSSSVAGIPVDTFDNIEQLSQHIISDSGEVTAGSAIAINPEKIIKSMQDEDIRAVLMQATIRYADGIGVVKTINRKTKQSITRIPGCELWEVLMQRSAEFNIPVFLIGATEEVIVATKDKLQQQYGTNVIGAVNGYFSKDEENKLIEELAKSQPKIVSVALGSPRQELFIQRCMDVCPDTYFMGVGGTYDVYSGKVKRAPELYRKLNLEWFYRVVNEPRRILRHGNLVRYVVLELARKL